MLVLKMCCKYDAVGMSKLAIIKFFVSIAGMGDSFEIFVYICRIVLLNNGIIMAL